VLKAAWFRPPGTPKDCLWAFGEDDSVMADTVPFCG
jgi:hypothetical protein